MRKENKINYSKTKERGDLIHVYYSAKYIMKSENSEIKYRFIFKCPYMNLRSERVCVSFVVLRF